MGIDHSVGAWTLATGLASKDMVELFAFTTVDMGLATLWWKLHFPAAVLVVWCNTCQVLPKKSFEVVLMYA